MMHSEDHAGIPDLEFLATPIQLLSPQQEQQLKTLKAHLEVCPECAHAADLHFALVRGRQVPAASTLICPSCSVWLELAAGVLPEAATVPLLAHAAACVICARELESMRHDVATEEIDPEVSQLQTSSAAWQSSMAWELAESSRQAAVVPMPALATIVQFPSRRLWFGAVAAALLIVGGFLGWSARRRNSDDALLARAYDLQRRTELRLPGGDAVPLASADRGAAVENPPSELVKLRLRALEHLEHNPGDAYWHAELGRVALVENNGAAAKRELETAAALNPALPRLTSDLASAWFEIGDTTGDRIPYIHAADLLSQVAYQLRDSHDREAVAVTNFNLALCWERLSNHEEAVKAYQNALAAESDPSWRSEIQRRLTHVQDIEHKSEFNRDPAQFSSPHAFLVSDLQDQEATGRDYDLYLDPATRFWLPAQGSSPEARAALERLALIGRAHDDAWLEDILSIAPSDTTVRAVDHLASAAEDSTRGDADAALTESEEADRLFRQAADAPGAMRAEAEEAYSYQRLGQAERCLDLTQQLLHQAAIARYAWMHAYILLEDASCRGDGGDIGQVTTPILQAVSISTKEGLQLELLRAQGFLANVYGALGQTREAWSISQEGLEHCAVQRGARMSTYQFLQSSYTATSALDLPWAAAGIADAASQASNFVSNLPIQAYSYETLGAAETGVGELAKAEEAFSHASDLLHKTPAGPAATFYLSDWEADRSELLAKRGQVHEALERMQTASLQVAAADNYVVRAKDYTELASLFLQNGSLQQALHSSVLATLDAEHALAGTSGEIQRRAWERRNGRAYRLLVQSLAMMGRNEDALRAWEWYRSAPFRSAELQPKIAAYSHGIPAFPPILPERRKGNTFVIARLEGRYVVWFVPSSSNRAIDMAQVDESSQQVESMGETLRELCSDRNSSKQAIRAVGEKMYAILFARFEPEMNSNEILQLDVDASLQRVPFSALARSGHPYLGLEHPIAILPAWWSVRTPPMQPLTDHPKVLLVEGSRSLPATPDGSIRTLQPEYLETSYLARMFPQAVLLTPGRTTTGQLTSLLASSEIFHFSGHAIERDHETVLWLSSPDVVFGPSALSGVSLRGCRLAVLATCSSSGADDQSEDTGSLTHALLNAGASNVVATLWDVDSRSSRDLMVSFYSKIAQGQSPAAALSAAEQALHSNPASGHPFYWAPMEVFIQ
jgi:CHAT domain-containing protein